METYTALLSDLVATLKDFRCPDEALFTSQEEAEWFQTLLASPIIAPIPPPCEEVLSVERKNDPEPSINDKQTLIKATLEKVAPSLRLVEKPVSVVLIACREDEETVELLKALAKAITTRLGKAKIIPGLLFEREKRWAAFFSETPSTLVLVSDGFTTLPGLMQFYKKPHDILGSSPLLTLGAASAYKDLAEKAALWKRLCQMLKT